MSFCELLKDKFFSSQAGQKFFDFGEILEKTRDTNLLFWVLEPKERTMIFRYSEKPEDHPVLRDLGEWGKKIQSFYLKTARLDRPLRIDFMGSEEIGNRIASIILSVSGHHSGYGLPAPLIEADNVAKLSEDDIESFYDQISSFTGNIPSVMKLRREMRPF
jgi:NurA-like 5'-3' nuclease